ncbi:MAG: hypothetical protein DWQ09_06240 [Proteobacteria bacterium]|nr:MAG: hypothetical protein DWQ09_06240 [Pseudomonadota bacterium]
MHWNAGGWFGAQIGATVWMLVAAVLTAIRDPSTGVVVLLLFVVPNVIGLMLWLSRKFSCSCSTSALVEVAMGLRSNMLLKPTAARLTHRCRLALRQSAMWCRGVADE